MISVRIERTKSVCQGRSCIFVCGSIICLFVLVAGLLAGLGLPSLKFTKYFFRQEPIAIIEDLDSNKKIAVSPNDTIGGNIKVLGVENGKIRMVVRQN